MKFRSLIHRLLIPWFPVLRLMGSVAGKRETAVSLLKSGFWVGVIPGREIFRGLITKTKKNLI